MRIIQLLTTLSFGDAVSNDALALRGAIADMGYETAIYAENIDRRLPKDAAGHISEMPELSSGDALLYHLSTGTDLNFRLPSFSCRKMMIYHNITPPEYFRPYSPQAAALTEYGLEGVRFLHDKVDYCLADSEYNKAELLKYGYDCPVDVRPVLVRFEDYAQPHDDGVYRKYTSDGFTNIIFVGRIAPNKKQEDLILTYYKYHKLNPKSRLILVGSYSGMENYHERLMTYAQRLGVAENVVFTGHISFPAILAFYKAADVFLCMSEHEGFCVPLVEAMYFDVPVIARRTSAIPCTMGNSGFLTDTDSPDFTAKAIERVVTDKQLRQIIIDGQRERLKDFDSKRVTDTFKNSLQKFLNMD